MCTPRQLHRREECRCVGGGIVFKPAPIDIKPSCTLTDSAMAQLCGFLSCHEHDIADGINDFSDLYELFEEVMKRQPVGS